MQIDKTFLNGCNSALNSCVTYCGGVDWEGAGVSLLLSGLISSHAVDLIDFSSKITSVSSLATEENRCAFSVPECEERATFGCWNWSHWAEYSFNVIHQIFTGHGCLSLLPEQLMLICSHSVCVGGRWEPQSLTDYERYFSFIREVKEKKKKCWPTYDYWIRAKTECVCWVMTC